ncbi:hypothetical protein B8W70_13145 [Pseudomonas sp. 1239]|uniref:DUF4034 domain-containing protein n=1 Tax=unclassified Pseudomonas TaxID=196821 RepID=UPI000B4F7965|nr:DUF4034 domain-containing protein [Pseudomonas sp. 1239]OUM29153.1 hypothetical protein B8W70_13145 [Pseudomonas sp. 1239]
MHNIPHIRLHLRDLVRTESFAELNSYFDALQAEWSSAEPGTHHYLDTARTGTLFDFSVTPAPEIARFLQAWVAACPDAFHPRLFLGNYCYGRAGNIRGNGWANSVTDDCWLGAALACELSAVHLLAALERSPQPVAAGVTLMELCAHFHEPAWLNALFGGEPAKGMASDNQDPETLEMAVEHLAHYGLTPLQQAPTALPAGLPQRQAHEMDQGQDYWLHRVMEWRPDCLEALLNYANYLLPRWGGSYEDIEGFASGPLCAALSEAQRNAIRWLAFYDIHEDYPAKEEFNAAREYLEHFEAWLQRDLLPAYRGYALGYFGQFCSYSLDNQPRAMAMQVASVQAFPEGEYFRHVEGPFHSFVYLTMVANMADETGAFKVAVERMCAMNELGVPVAIKAVGHQFGLWGFDKDPQCVPALLDRARVLGEHDLGDSGLDIVSLPSFLWDGGRHDEGYFLAVQWGERGLPGAAYFLHEVHTGAREEAPQRYVDESESLRWLERGAQDGCPQSMFNLAWKKLFDDELDMRVRANLDEVLRLFEGARQSSRAEQRARIRIGILLRDFGTAEEQQTGVKYLRSLVDCDDDWVSARTSAEIALAYLRGQGVQQSRFAAIEWAQHAVTQLPDNEGIQEVQYEVLNSHSLLKSVTSVFGAFLGRGRVGADDLPPKPAQ